MKERSGIRFFGRDREGKKVYEINYQIQRDGKSVRQFQRVRVKSLREAQIIRAELITEAVKANEKADVKKREATFTQLREWLESDLRSSGLRKKTVIRALNSFDAFFFRYLSQRYPEVRKLAQLQSHIIYEYRMFIVEGEQRVKGWRTELSTLKALMKRLHNGGFLPDAILEYLGKMKRPPLVKKDVQVITLRERKVLLEFIKKHKPQFYGIAYLLTRLGWRIEEVVSLRKKDVGWEDGRPVSVRIDASIRKNGIEFVLKTLDDAIARVIIEYARKNQKSIWLFPNRVGNKFKQDDFRLYLRKVSQQTIKRVVLPHDFRHSLCTFASQARVSIADLMAITGHLDYKTILQFYQHSTEKGRRDVLKLTQVW